MAERKQKRAVKKIFVLDTNVIMEDWTSVAKFDEHDVVIPFTVVEELDRHKDEVRERGYNSRRFSNFLKEMGGRKPFNGGASLGEGKGMISVKICQGVHEDIVKIFAYADTPDNRILDVAYRLTLQHQNDGIQVVFVSYDTNACLKADALGIYNDPPSYKRVKDPVEKEEEWLTVENVKSELIDRLYKEKQIPVEDIGVVHPLRPNDRLHLINGSKQLLTVVKEAKDESLMLRQVKWDVTAAGIKAKNNEQRFALDALFDPEIELVSISGGPGSGKTLLAIAAALEQAKNYKKIHISRMPIPIGKDIGYLPGSADEKMEKWMASVRDNIEFIQGYYTDKSLFHASGLLDVSDEFIDKKVVIEAPTFIRGRSLPGIWWIYDEVQNLEPGEVTTTVTRAGEGTKIIMIGDISQIDRPHLDRYSNGLSYLISRMSGYKGYAHITLHECIRSRLASEAASRL